jgi:hypothetical protein
MEVSSVLSHDLGLFYAVSTEESRDEKENVSTKDIDNENRHRIPDLHKNKLNREADIRLEKLRTQAGEEESETLEAESKEAGILEEIGLQGEIEEIEKLRADNGEERLLLQVQSPIEEAISYDFAQTTDISRVLSLSEETRLNTEQKELKSLAEEDDHTRMSEGKKEQLQLCKEALFKRLDDIKCLMQTGHTKPKSDISPDKKMLRRKLISKDDSLVNSLDEDEPMVATIVEMPLKDQKEALLRKIEKARSLLEKKQEIKRTMTLDDSKKTKLQIVSKEYEQKGQVLAKKEAESLLMIPDAKLESTEDDLKEEIELMLRVENFLYLEALNDETTQHETNTTRFDSISQFMRERGELQRRKVNDAKYVLEYSEDDLLLNDLKSQILELEKKELDGILWEEENLHLKGFDFMTIDKSLFKTHQDGLLRKINREKMALEAEHEYELADDMKTIGFVTNREEGGPEKEDHVYLEKVNKSGSLVDESLVDGYREALSRHVRELKALLEAEEEMRLIEEAYWLMEKKDEGAFQNFSALMAVEQARIRAKQKENKLRKDKLHKESTRHYSVEKFADIAKEAEEALQKATGEAQLRKRRRLTDGEIEALGKTLPMYVQRQNSINQGNQSPSGEEEETLEMAVESGRLQAIEARIEQTVAENKDEFLSGKEQVSKNMEDLEKKSAMFVRKKNGIDNESEEDVTNQQILDCIPQLGTRSLRIEMDGSVSLLQSPSTKELKISTSMDSELSPISVDSMCFSKEGKTITPSICERGEDEMADARNVNVGDHVLTIVGLVAMYSTSTRA